MAIVQNNQSFSPYASGYALDALITPFKAATDAILLDLGRDVTIHLPPSKQKCSDPTCKFNSFYKKFTGPTNKLCELCKGQGFILEPRQTIYRANLRWTNEAFNEARNINERHEVGRIGQNFLRMKTVADSMTHIRQSIGATIDTIDVELFEEPRYTGFGRNLLYVISWWKVVNR